MDCRRQTRKPRGALEKNDIDEGISIPLSLNRIKEFIK
jgi:hypothetical protein